MLILLQPGIEPVGQWDVEDDDVALIVGGEVGILTALDEATDAYAADVWAPGPKIHVSIGDVASDGQLYGLVDEGISGYGTSFGTLIGATTGQGTGFGEKSTTGVVVMGPSTIRGSGKVTLWTKPGLYGVTHDAWASESEFGAMALNGDVFGHAEDGTLDGKLTSTSTSNGQQVALSIGLSTDTSLVSTTNAAAGADNLTEYGIIYLLGVQK